MHHCAMCICWIIRKCVMTLLALEFFVVATTVRKSIFFQRFYWYNRFFTFGFLLSFLTDFHNSIYASVYHHIYLIFFVTSSWFTCTHACICPLIVHIFSDIIPNVWIECRRITLHQNAFDRGRLKKKMNWVLSFYVYRYSISFANSVAD